MKTLVHTKWFLLLPLAALTWGERHLDPVRDQILLYKQRNEGIKTILTTSNGAPVDYRSTSTLNNSLIYNNYFLDSINHITRERIPERIVHGKGVGAFGYLEVTHNVTEYIKADFLNEIGKKTAAVVRFSLTNSDRGLSDSSRGIKGFSVKLYTKEGNLDLLCLNTRVFAFKDPILFSTLTHAQGRNPATHILDSNMQWDFLTQHPESFNMFMSIFGDDGIPKGYRHMSGHCVHTYQVQNKFGKIYFARFHFIPEDGEAYLTSEEAAKLDASDPDSFTRDLYEAIACGKRVSWIFGLQLVTLEQALNSKIDVFDPTLELPFDDYPLTPVGKLVLDRNPVNHFAEIEQLAYCPCNLVPGFDGAPDKLFQARLFAYRYAQLYRLGANFNKIEVNCPFATVVHTYNRDGVAPVGDNGRDAPNYYGNSFNGPVAYNDFNRANLIEINEKEPDNYKQAAQTYLNMTEDQKHRLISNIVNSLGPATSLLHERAMKIFYEIDEDLGDRIKRGLHEFTREPVCKITFDEISTNSN